MKLWPCKNCLFISYGALIIRAIRDGQSYDVLAKALAEAGWEQVNDYGGFVRRCDSCSSRGCDQSMSSLRGGFEFL
jgi:hypothetical protein